MAAHKWADVIKAWADGEKVQMKANGEWQDHTSKYPTFSENIEYRIKPAESERVYPQISIEVSQKVCEAYQKGSARDGSPTRGWVAAGNAALRHAIDAGQVVTREEFDKLAKELEQANQYVAIKQGIRDARDMAVAKAVQIAAAGKTSGTWETIGEARAAVHIYESITKGICLEDIIARVQQ